MPKQKKLPCSYEPSGLIQLTNGQLLVADDDGNKPFTLYGFNSFSPFDTLEKIKSFNLKPLLVDDLEALTIDSSDQIYAITSHSRDADGKVKKKRCRLLRLQLTGEKITEIFVIDELRTWLLNTYAIFKKSAKIKKVQKKEGFNIEGLAHDPNQEQLLIAFRSPLSKNNKAIIVPLDVSKKTFNRSLLEKQKNKPIYLNLKGAGVRDLTYIPKLDGFLILSGSVCDSKKSTQLWFWQRSSLCQDKQLRRVKIKGIKKLGRAEGISPVRWNNQEEGILLVMDDGDKYTEKFGHYLFIAYKHLMI